MNISEQSRWNGNVVIHPLPVPLEEPYGRMVRIGLIALSTDPVIERDFAHLVPDNDVAVFTTRIHIETPNSDRTFLALQDEITAATKLIIPDSRLDVVVFGCTSASTIIGPDRIAELVAVARPDARCTNPATAAIGALRKLSARRIALVTPYTEQMTRNVSSFLQQAHFELSSVRSFGFDTDATIGSIPEEAFVDAVRKSDLSDVDAVFISCTGTKALNVIDRLEDELGLPVVVSNQAAFWHALTLAGWTRPIEGHGRLLRSEWN